MRQVPPEDHRRPGTTRRFLYLRLRLSALDFTAALCLLQIENSFSLSVPIFKQFHKNIIGKGGANIKKVRLGSTDPVFINVDFSHEIEG